MRKGEVMSSSVHILNLRCCRLSQGKKPAVDGCMDLNFRNRKCQLGSFSHSGHQGKEGDHTGRVYEGIQEV